MGKINILDSSVFNRIAAGEVVERPASVLKELLDNAIDSKATEIEINVLEGGIKQIEVIDNGCGIEFDDLNRVFLAHATSKIKTAEDLEKIGTLGFRGEALASIAAVSEMTIVSKPKEQELGGKITASAGKQDTPIEIGAKDGTRVRMENLFFNVPARAKFLKKPKQEASEITNLVSRYILANPDIKIKYNLDGENIYSSTGKGLFEAIYVVYNKNTTDNILKVNLKSNSGITISGYIGNTTFTKPNRTYQTLVINGRYVQNQMISLCVYNAFEHSLMKGQFPFYVLHINMPLESLDVNVHPNKMEVRFENSNQMYGIVYEAVMDALNSNANNIIEVNKKVYDFENVNASGVSFNPNKEEQKTDGLEVIEIKTEPNIELKEASQENNQTINFYENLNNTKQNSSFQNSNLIMSNIFDKISIENKENKTVFADDKIFEKNEVELVNDNIQSKLFDGGYKIIGVLFKTYIIVESEENCYLIDQHASHERVLYDKLTNQVNSNELKVQNLLIPYTLNVNSKEKEFLDNNLEALNKLGFEINEFGSSSFRVLTVPQVLIGINLNDFFGEVLSELSVFKNLKQSDLILEKLMQHSCKTAVKAGDTLSPNEIKTLIYEIEKEDTKLQCPHGRPVIVKLSKKEIEKWFKRIV